MHINICICICSYLYVYIYMYTYIYVYVHTHIYIHINICIRMYLHLYLYLYLYACLHVFISILSFAQELCIHGVIFFCEISDTEVRIEVIVDVNITAMVWLRFVGSFKLHVSFAKEPYKRDDILQKTPILLRSLLIIATPYDIPQTHTHVWCKHIGLFCKRAL